MFGGEDEGTLLRSPNSPGENTGVLSSQTCTLQHQIPVVADFNKTFFRKNAKVCNITGNAYRQTAGVTHVVVMRLMHIQTNSRCYICGSHEAILLEKHARLSLGVRI